MTLKSYGVLVARAVDRRREGAPDDTPHLQIHLVDDDGIHYRAAVNVKSQLPPSDVLYLAIEHFLHPVTEHLAELGPGWHPCPSTPDGASIDFVRGNMLNRDMMRPLPPELPDVENDLSDMLDHHVARAIHDETARVYIFGEPWGPEPDVPDKVFGFVPGNGVHDIHMNQGNHPSFRDDDGVWQDGAILLWYPRYDQWVAIFLAFASQSWRTDDTTGHAIPSVLLPGQSEVVWTDRRVRIVGALVNPTGSAPEQETVTLLNTSADPVDLTGWALTDRLEQRMEIDRLVLPPGETTRLSVRPPLQLGNGGGLISLLEPSGAKVDGVAYTSQDAATEGWTVTFSAG